MTDRVFTGRSFGITPLRGVRAFSVDHLGRLVGAREHVWSPGEQRARCLTTDSSAEEIASGTHDPRDCTCGFYGYHDGVSDFDLGYTATVHGVVEGYGLVSVGTRGFRATRARLVAIALPEKGDRAEDPTDSYHASTRWEWWCLVRDTLLFLLAALSGAAVFIGLIVGAATIPDDAENLGPVKLVGLVFVVAAALLIVGTPIFLLKYHPSLGHRVPWRPRDTGLSDEAVARVRRNYPDVAVLPTLAALREAYPPSEPPEDTVEPVHEPSPENDPDFWTRP